MLNVAVAALSRALIEDPKYKLIAQSEMRRPIALNIDYVIAHTTLHSI